jgi:hypothetical protein
MRFKRRAAVRHHVPRQTYRITNWRAYEAGLRNRGSLTVWFSEAAIAAWKGLPSGKQGGQPRSCELAIETALAVRIVFRLALRQCEGLIGSVMHRLGIDLAVPDHTTLSRRVRELKVDAKPHSGTNNLHLIVDSTGLKLRGAGDWLQDKHGTGGKRRSWFKLRSAWAQKAARSSPPISPTRLSMMPRTCRSCSIRSAYPSHHSWEMAPLTPALSMQPSSLETPMQG